MNKMVSFHVWHFLWASMATFILIGCGAAAPAITPTSDWQPIPTYSYYIPPSNVPGYAHYIPSEAFKIRLEFDYPSYWWLEEYINEIGMLNLLIRDPGFLTLPTPIPPNIHTEPNDFGYIIVWIMSGEPGQTPNTELDSHKKAYSEHHRMKVLRDYKIKIDGYDASVLEYQEEDWEAALSLQFVRRTYFMVNGQVYEIIYCIADKDRGGQFDKGYEYFINSLKIVP